MTETRSMRELLLARITGDDRARTRVPLCLVPSLAQTYAEAKESLAEAERAAGPEDARKPGKLAGDPLHAARKALEAASDAASGASVQLVLQALPEAEWRAYLANWRRLADDDPSKISDNKLIADCLVGVEDMDGGKTDITPEDVVKLLPHLGAGESGTLGAACAQINNEVPDIPFSARP